MVSRLLVVLMPGCFVQFVGSLGNKEAGHQQLPGADIENVEGIVRTTMAKLHVLRGFPVDCELNPPLRAQMPMKPAALGRWLCTQVAHPNTLSGGDASPMRQIATLARTIQAPLAPLH